MVPAKLVIGKRVRDSRQGAEGTDSSPSETSDSARASWKTLPNQKPRHMSYRGRMTVMFAAVAGMTALILVAVLAVTWEAQFLSYTRANMERYASSVADALADGYNTARGWDDEAVERAVQSSSVLGDVGVQVVDDNGTIIYDDTWARSDRAQTFGSDAAGKAGSLAPVGADSVVSHDVTLSDGRTVGTVRLWAFGSEALLTKGDAAFRTSSYGAVVTAGIVAVFLACIMGVLVSRKLAKPIKSITSTAAQIRSGDLTARTGISGDDEIGQLGETFDDMATSLERDLKLEHRLTSDVAHELRTPLMAMLATVEAMQDGVLPADEEHLETVASEVRRLSRLVAAMLQLSRIENGTTPFKPTKTDMVGLVRSVVESQEQLFADRGLRLRLDIKQNRREIVCDVDRDMIRQALINLMSNALRYTPENGWVVVSLAQEGREVVVSVSDTGIGIAKEDLARVFSRFWRSDASRERESGGLGVGLAVTKEIIDRHHGFICVESELGKGTKFTLHIPRDQGRSPKASASDVKAPTTDTAE
ncbi:ATP-binding protein [uncultured Parolsenella sp.]|uniref:sensor histidine kinase n=1 Tax=uncultured Parolsenella sp. TaxID=2083008 RepID=UPI0027D9C1AF|nr:ATP-binding protein [uncultured Parolsenella sp.]